MSTDLQRIHELAASIRDREPVGSRSREDAQLIVNLSRPAPQPKPNNGRFETHTHGEITVASRWFAGDDQ